MGLPITVNGWNSIPNCSARMCANAWRQAEAYRLARMRWRDGSRLKSGDDASSFLIKYDALLLPSTPIPALPIEDIENSANQAPALTRFTAPFNLTGLPALSVPCGFTKDGLPIGLQIVCGQWQEAKLLRAGHAFEHGYRMA